VWCARNALSVCVCAYVQRGRETQREGDRENARERAYACAGEREREGSCMRAWQAKKNLDVRVCV